MPNYDFHQLSPYDLELLVRDLLQAHWKVTIESFKSGQDWGIDLRYANGPHQTIIQVKHYLRTGLKGLIKDLKAEGEKVSKLNPNRYHLVTSLPLSPPDKQAIVDRMGLSCLTSSGVMGADELNNLLGLYPEVETRQYKLWLASTAVLDRVLHNAEYTRSQFKVQQVYEKIRRYVPSRVYGEALDMINAERIVIIAGAPGVGKTTLADLILYEHLARGYQAVEIQRDISEGEKLFHPDRKQIFYFDDFMGATFHGDRVGALSGVGDRALLNFIDMVRASTDSRLVMTTREHVYAQAFFRSERLRNSDLNDMQVVLNMPAYSKAQRGRILYNHVYFSDLPPTYRQELLDGQFYVSIVKHEKFNPRLIEWLSSFRRVKAVPVSEYQAFIRELLRDPSEIWQHAYEQEISEAGRTLLLVLYAMGGKANAGKLKQGFLSLHAVRSERYRFQSRPEDFAAGVRELANSFIKPTEYGGFTVIDPSIIDLMNSMVRLHPENAIDIIVGAVSFDEVLQIWKFAIQDRTQTVLCALIDQQAAIAGVIGGLAMLPRRVEMGKGAFGYVGPSYETRLKTLIEMGERLTGAGLRAELAKAYTHLTDSWAEEWININDAVELVRTLGASAQIPRSLVDAMLPRIETELLECVKQGRRADELREVLTVVDTSDPESEIVASAREAYEAYRAVFQQDLSDCNSVSQFEGLIEDLEYFRDCLGVDVSRLVVLVEDEKAEFEENEEARSDQMYDEWKDRRHEERHDDHDLTQMFDSLRDERE